MIWLDGIGYHVDKTNYADKSTTLASYARGVTGKLLVVESGVEQQQLTIQLNVSQPESELLRAAFIKCHNTGVYLDFVDARGVAFLVATGTDVANVKYFSTGVWIAALGEPKPATEALFDPAASAWFSPYKRFTVEVQLMVNSVVVH